MAFTNAVDAHATFAGGCQGFYLVATADCLVDFDQPTDAGSLLVKANIFYDLSNLRGNILKLHVQGNGGSGNLHIVGIRGGQ